MAELERAMSLVLTCKAIMDCIIILPIVLIVAFIIYCKIKDYNDSLRYEKEENDYKLQCELKYGQK